jgi:two-component system OmpR family sensor kinase
MRIPGGIRVRLTLGLALIVAGALGTAYLIVVPSLERDLVDARLDELERRAPPLAEGLPEDRFEWPEEVERLAVATNARVVVLEVVKRTPPTLVVLEDSRRRSSRDLIDDAVARDAVISGKLERGRSTFGSSDFADVALPLSADTILLFRAPLEDSLATVRLVQKRLLLATLFALALAIVLGLTAAGMLANRLRRLEVAAERISGGDFSAPIVDHGDDEIGQLAVAFDRMRVRLAQLDNARKEFVANASHELRTPLFSLGGFLELLSDEELDDATRREFIATMQGQMERLTKLSTDLLDLSRVDAGQLRVVEEPVDLSDVGRSLAAELEHLAAASGHQLEVEVEDDVWAAADEERVVQVGRALLVNALVHTPAGTRIVVRAHRRGDRVELGIEDNGPGIPPEHQEAVFERFYRIDDGAMASGSGLGLAIARELARLMGGSVGLESEPRKTLVVLDLAAEPVPDLEAVAAPAFSRENGDGSNGSTISRDE